MGKTRQKRKKDKELIVRHKRKYRLDRKDVQCTLKIETDNKDQVDYKDLKKLFESIFAL